MWQPNCQKCERKKKGELWQPSCRKLGEKFNSNLGNEVAENEGGGEDLSRKLKEKKSCGNWFVAKKLPKWEEKKIVAIDLWQCCYWNGRKKNWGNWFVAMELPKWEGEKKNYGNEVAKNWMRERERERENCLDKIK